MTTSSTIERERRAAQLAQEASRRAMAEGDILTAERTAAEAADHLDRAHALGIAARRRARGDQPPPLRGEG